jgi:lipopolysaccharide exporter
VEDKAIRGIPWTFLGYLTNKVITLGTTLVLARLLVPADFGLVALALSAIVILSLFNDLGLGASLVVRQDLDLAAQRTVLTLMLVMGAAVAALIAALSPLAAKAFREPRLAGILAVLASTVLFGGLSWFYEALLHRELEFSRRFVTEIVQTLTVAVSTIVLAALGAGVWSLVVGQVAGSVAYGAALVTLAPYHVKPGFDRAVARDVLSTGRGFLMQAGAAYLHDNVDNMVVGRSLGAAQLGFYSMAFRLGDLPSQAIVDPVATVTFPGFARMRHRGEDIVPSYLSALRLIALAACPLGVVLSATADPLTRALFGERWLTMIGPLSVFGLWAALRPLQTTVAWLLNSVGHALSTGLVEGFALLALVPLLIVAATLGGVTAVAWTMVFNVTMVLLALSLVARRRTGLSLGRQWRALRPVVIACPLSWAAARAVAESTAGSPGGVSLACSAAAGILAYAIAVTLVEPGTLRRAATQLGRTARRAVVAAPNP